jgi:tetratricopeptide (TPR) repeat protein
MKIKLLLLLFSTVFSSAYAQNTKFDSIADELNRVSLYKKAKSLELLDSLYQMAYSSPDSSLLIARCLYEESLLNFRNGLTDTLFIKRIEMRIDRKNSSLHEQALLHLSLGIELENTGEYSDAFTIYLQTLEEYKQLQDNRFIARTLNSLGSICNTLNLFSLAEYYYSEAIKNITPESHEYIQVKSNLYRAQFHSNKSEIAIDSMLYLIEIAEKENREELLPALYLNIGSYFVRSDREKASQYFAKLQTLDFDSPRMLAALYINMGAFYGAKEDFSKALYYFRDAQKTAEENNNLGMLSAIYRNISLLFEELNRLDSALFYAKKHTQIVQTIRSHTVAIEIHQKLITSTLEVHQNELIITKQQITLKNRQVAIIVIVSGSIILLILFFLLFINQQKRRKISENRELATKLEYEKKVQQYEKRQRKLEKEKQEEILDAKTREITSYSLLVSNKNNILNQIKETNAQIFDNKENAAEIAKKTDEIIRNNLNIDEEWDTFKMHFDKVHQHFFEKLKQSCSNLTEENLKMCAYFKIGMTTKQIAQLLHVDPHSVIISRYRLKKKLQLSDGESLDDFVRNL